MVKCPRMFLALPIFMLAGVVSAVLLAFRFVAIGAPEACRRIWGVLFLTGCGACTVGMPLSFVDGGVMARVHPPLQVFGCVLFAVSFLLWIVAAAISLVTADRQPRIPPRLLRPMLDFIACRDRSAHCVAAIHTLLIAEIASDDRYEDLLSAVGSFAPAGRPPFHDEVWLADVFRTFLCGQGVDVPDHEGVWPPAPVA